MRESIFYASVRALCIAFFTIIGIFLAFIPFILFYNYAGVTSDEITSEYDVKILPNAKGIRKKQSASAPVILQINIDNTIGLDNATEKNIRSILVESREGTLKNERVKAILLYCNTPGGGMTDADGIYRALKEYKEQYKVPIFAFVDGLLASGGMYIGAAADEIHATDSSLIGSVGVITTSFLNLSNLMEKVGVTSLTLYAGKGKDDLNPLRPWKSGEADNFKEVVDYYYQKFVDLVVANRPKVNRSLLVDKLGANIFPAPQAVQYGFIDYAGATRSSTLEKLLAKLSIEDDFYQVVQLESSNWFNQLFKSESPMWSGKIKHEVVLGNELPPELTNQILYLYRP